MASEDIVFLLKHFSEAAKIKKILKKVGRAWRGSNPAQLGLRLNVRAAARKKTGPRTAERVAVAPAAI